MQATFDAETAALRNAWQAYNAATENARLSTEATQRFRDRPEHRATAYRSIIEAQAMAYNWAVAPRMDHPLINTRTWYHDVHTLGGTSADLYHVGVIVDPRRTYRLFGRVGDMKIFVMQVFNTILGGDGQKQLANIDLAEMAGPDGSFELILGGEQRPGAWAPLDPGADLNFLFVRRFFYDWSGDRGSLDIELLDGPVDNRDLDQSVMARRIERAAETLTFLVDKWNIGFYDLVLSRNDGRKNAVVVVPGNDIASDTAGSPSTIYTWAIYEIQSDEALIIEADMPQARFWSVEALDVWTKPIDFLHRQSDINGKHMIIDNDGKYRAVLSFEDPGVANWLDSGGRQEGIIVGRAYHPEGTPTAPTLKIVKTSELRNHLPQETSYVTPEQRRSALKFRRNSLLQMFGDT